MESTAGPRKRQQAASASGSVAPYFPEDIVRKILLFLPSRSVQRCRAVCKHWLRIVSDPKFAADHDHYRQPTLPLIFFLRGGDAGTKAEAETETSTGAIVDCCVDAFDLSAGSFRPVVRFTDKEERCRSFHIHGSCDGLLLLSFEDRFYVCNPATHQWTRLPTPLRDSWLAGFYHHEPTGDYRALFYRSQWPREDDYYIMVPDSRRGKGIGLPAEKDGYKFTGQPHGPPVLHRGHLHWMPRQTAEDYGILAFNTTTEVLRVTRPPLIREHMSLAEVGGELAVFSCGNQATMVEVWLLKDYENAIWVCMHRIRLPAVNGSTFTFDESWRMFFMSEEGVVIVTPEQKLVHYDMNGTLLESFVPCDNGRHLKIAPFTFKESLVQHAFFEKQHCNADDHEDPPPFFRGL